MYAIIETGGKQYQVSAGQTVTIEKLDAAIGSEVKLDKVIAIIKEAGSVFGTPYVPSASVVGEVVGAGRGDKVMVFKQKPRKAHRKIRGHRQSFSVLKIKEIQHGA